MKATSQTLQTVRKVEPYVWLLPSILMMGVMILIPIITVFQSSFSEISKAGINRGWNGIANYISIFNNPTFWHTLQNTLVWTIVVVGLSTVIGFTLAMILNVEFKGRKIARAVIVFPWATALIIQAVVWKYIISPEYGALNTLLYNLGLIDSYVNWTATPAAFFAWECWVLSGLQSIDGALYEAADVDGIGFWGKLFKITLPLVMPSLSVSTVLNIIYVFNSFPIIWTISKGDPADQTHTLVTYLYDLSFSSGKFGEAAAVSVIGFIVLSICASIYMVISLKSEQEG